MYLPSVNHFRISFTLTTANICDTRLTEHSAFSRLYIAFDICIQFISLSFWTRNCAVVVLYACAEYMSARWAISVLCWVAISFAFSSVGQISQTLPVEISGLQSNLLFVLISLHYAVLDFCIRMLFYLDSLPDTVGFFDVVDHVLLVPAQRDTEILLVWDITKLLLYPLHFLKKHKIHYTGHSLDSHSLMATYIRKILRLFIADVS